MQNLALANLLLLHGLGHFLDELFGMVVKLCWMTAILTTVLVVKKIDYSIRGVMNKSALIALTLLGFILISSACLLLLPGSLIDSKVMLDPRPLLGIGSAIVWLTIALDILSLIKARESQQQIGIAETMVVLFLPIVGAAYYLISNKAKEGKALGP